MSTRVFVTIGLVLVALLGGVSFAQVTTATLHTEITDSSGAVVPDAKVTLAEERTGVTRSQVASERGESVFSFVPIGVYTVTVGAPGFKTSSVSQLQLSAGQQLQRTFVLEIGNVTDTVSVTAELPLVNTVTAEQLETTKWAQISELPLANRRASNLFEIGTAIQRGAPTGMNNTAGSYRMNGLGSGAMNLTMDGIPGSGHPATPQGGLRGGFNYIEVVSLEAIEEISVAKGAFAAEFRHAMSGNINVVTKSGTNEWHGTLFHDFNVEELNARAVFLATKPASTFNQFGGSLGGPILKDKIFIFGVYEGYRDRRFATHQALSPTQRLRNDMLRAVPEYKLALDQMFLPNTPHDPNAATALVIVPATFSANDDEFLVKPDAWLGSRGKISATWLRARPDIRQPGLFLTPGPTAFRNFIGKLDRLNVTFTTFGPGWSAETRFGRNRVDNDRLDDFFNLIDPLKPESSFGQRRQMSISALGFNTGGEKNFVGNATHWIIEQQLSLQRGSHSLKFGGLLNRAGFGGSILTGPAVNYNTEADLLANTPVAARFDFGSQPWVGRPYYAGFFAQDDWKATPNLTLNLGVRYDRFGAMTVGGVDGGPLPAMFIFPFIDFFNFVPGPTRPPNDPYESDNMNVGPRFGFAYNVGGTGKTVVRGGFGVMFSPPNLTLFELTPQNDKDIPFRVQPSKVEIEGLGIKFPTYNEDVLRFFRGGVSPNLVDPEIRAPYAYNYTLGVQQALTPTLMLETAFVGTGGRKFSLPRQYNRPNAVTGVRPNPNLGGATYWDNSDSTTYASWQTSLRKRYSHNLSGSLHYTWGKGLAYGIGELSFDAVTATQDVFDVKSNRGLVGENIQHRLIGDFVHELPIMSNAGPLLRNALGGWQASGIFLAQTGFPLTVTQSSARPGGRPDIIDFDRAVLNQGLQYLNPAAFAPVPTSPVSGFTVRPGTAGRNALIAPGRWNLDFSLAKNFKISERAKLQFRADMLNAFNHVDLINVSTNISNSNFGQLVGATDSRRIQFHLRFSF